MGRILKLRIFHLKSKIFRYLNLIFIFVLMMMFFVSCSNPKENVPIGSSGEQNVTMGDDGKEKVQTSVNNHKVGNSVDESMTSENSTANENDENLVVWKIEALDKDIADELIGIWQEPLNKLLKEKGADYKVKIVSFEKDYFEDENYGLAEFLSDKEENRQVDIITSSAKKGKEIKNPYVLYSQEDIFMPLNKYLETENGGKIKSCMNEKDLELSSIDGVIYGLGTVLPSYHSWAYDRDILDKLGIDLNDLSGSLFENNEILGKYKAEYDVVPVTANTNSYFCIGRWQPVFCEAIAFSSSGKFINAFDDVEFRDKIKKLYQLKEQGLLKIDETKIDSMVFSIHGESFTDAPYEKDEEFKNRNGAEFTKRAYIVPDLEQPILALYRGDVRTGITSWTKNKENAEDFLLKLFTDPDIANLIQYGVEDENYEKIGDNRIKITNLSKIFQMVSYQYTNSLITYSTDEMPENKLEYQKEYFEKNANEFPCGFRFDGSSVSEEIEKCNQVTEYAYNPQMINENNERYNNIINLNVDDVDKEIDLLVKDLKEAGIERIIEEANSQLDTWMKNVCN